MPRVIYFLHPARLPRKFTVRSSAPRSSLKEGQHWRAYVCVWASGRLTTLPCHLFWKWNFWLRPGVQADFN